MNYELRNNTESFFLSVRNVKNFIYISPINSLDCFASLAMTNTIF